MAQLVMGKSSRFPNAISTGVQDGITLTPVGGSEVDINSSGVYENKEINGVLVVNANNVTVRNCKVTAVTGQVSAVVYVAPGKTGAVIEYCDIDGAGVEGLKGVWVDAANGAIIRYCDIRASEDGIYFFADNVEIRHNYIHALITAGADPHHDCLQFAGIGLIIDHNSLIGAADANACLQFANGSDTIQVTINNNLLRPGAALYPVNIADGAVDHEDIAFTNNVFQEGNIGGGGQKYVTWNFRPPDVWIGNTDFVTGNPIATMP